MNHTPVPYDTVLAMLDTYEHCRAGPVHAHLEDAGTSPAVLEQFHYMIAAEFSFIEERNTIEHPQRPEVFSRARALGLDWLLMCN